MNPYESRELLAEYLLFHYGDRESVLGSLPGPEEAIGFPWKLIEHLLDPTLVPIENSRALDIGCAVGASSFALTRRGIATLGIDYSDSFIAAAQSLAANGRIEVEVPVEGHCTTPFVARVPPEIDRTLVRFQTGDAQNLPPDLGDFDVVVAANLLCRLPDPRQLLARLPGLVAAGGQLLLTTPFSWLEEYTPVENWLGGTPGSASSFEVLSSILESDFQLADRIEIPMLIREHARKFQYTVVCGSRWIRRG